ncbi:DUF3888 domain-containing protein [Alkaliphilus transvaalensis]|uniref:DUF3888 domain-containing protein n=1 Tax=Alkaliphilus transvaalensis TaxID=114628 RepID=UPI00047EEA65|nr:DUF3888 domain-containing protein [Alkaliphilus transvaalensis]
MEGLLNYKKTQGLPRTFYFIIDIELVPYIGPHNSVGIDQITLIVEGSCDVEIVDFRHIKDFIRDFPVIFSLTNNHD